MQNEEAASKIQKIKDNHGLTGRGRNKWKYYEAMDEVLGHRQATRPPVVIDTTENPIAEEIENMTDDKVERENNVEGSAGSSLENSGLADNLDNAIFQLITLKAKLKVVVAVIVVH